MKSFDKCCIIVARKVILFFVDDKKVSFCFVISIIDVYGTWYLVEETNYQTFQSFLWEKVNPILIFKKDKEKS